MLSGCLNRFANDVVNLDGKDRKRMDMARNDRRGVSHGTRARISAVDRLEYFLRSRASKVVVLALVANTMVAQLLYNSSLATKCSSAT